MVIFHSYVKLPEGIKKSWFHGGHRKDHSRITNGFKLACEESRTNPLRILVLGGLSFIGKWIRVMRYYSNS